MIWKDIEFDKVMCIIPLLSISS